jgi:IS4 transposase
VYASRQSFYFISRKNYNIKIFDVKSGKEIDLVKELKKKGFIDQEVLAGSDYKLKVRLIAIPLSEAQANERRRKARADRDKRLNHSPEYNYLLGFGIFITNIKPDKCNAEQISQLYRLRWRIEIIFKSWKSCFSLQSLIHFQCTNAVRVRCIIYLTLLYIYLFHVVWWNHCLKKTNNKAEEAQLSILKMAHFFNDQFTSLITVKSDAVILKQLRKHCVYDKRKDRTNAVEFYNKLAA